MAMNNHARKMNDSAHVKVLTGSLDTSAAPGRLIELTAAEYTTVYGESSPQALIKDWLLEIFTAGKIELNVQGGGWVRRPEGTGILYAPGVRRCERGWQGSLVHRPTTSLYARFDFDGPCPLASLLRTGEPFRWILDSGGEVQRLLAQVVHGLSKGTLAGQTHAVGCFHQMVAVLLSAPSRGGQLVARAIEADLPDLVAGAHLYMRENLAGPVRLRDIADHLGLSESGFAHAYRRITGRGPMATLRGFRIEAARQRLIRGRWKLQAIAEQTGFADAFHLSRTFKRMTGASPSRFLARMGHEGGARAK